MALQPLPPWVQALELAQADFLALVNRLLPTEYLAPLFSPGPGGEIYYAQAAIGARVSLAISNFQADSYITSAPDGNYATAAVLFKRPTAAAGAVTVKAGTIVQTATYGRQFSLLADVPFGAADLQAPGVVQALYPGEQWNVKGPYVSAGGELVPGEISQVASWILSPAFGDSTLYVVQTAGATGGQSSVLNMHGADRGYTRLPGEAASAYRSRVRSLPDTVSPGALQRTVTQFAIAYPGTTFDFIEPWQQSFQTCYDCPSPNAGVPNSSASIPSNLNTNLFVYDDPRPPYPFLNRWLDELTYRGCIVVTVPTGPAASGAPSIYQQLSRIKAGGVYVDLELQGQ